jgi:hypothetical protein
VLRTLASARVYRTRKHPTITDHKKGDLLLGQGDHDINISSWMAF